MRAEISLANPNVISVYFEALGGPFISSDLGTFDPRRDLEVYVDGVLITIQSFSFDIATNRYLLFPSSSVNPDGLIQVVHHIPDPPFATDV